MHIFYQNNFSLYLSWIFDKEKHFWKKFECLLFRNSRKFLGKSKKVQNPSLFWPKMSFSVPPVIYISKWPEYKIEQFPQSIFCKKSIFTIFTIFWWNFVINGQFYKGKFLENTVWCTKSEQKNVKKFKFQHKLCSWIYFQMRWVWDKLGRLLTAKRQIFCFQATFSIGKCKVWPFDIAFAKKRRQKKI